MAEPRHTPPSRTLIDSLGEEIVRIVTPVSICMSLVVILVSILNSNTDDRSISVSGIATIAYDESTSDSSWDKFLGALLNSLAFVVVVTLATFLLVLLFYFRCTRFLRFYMAFSAFVVLGFLGGEISLFLIQHFSTPIDCVTFFIALCNFAVVGVLAVFVSKMPIVVTQGYLVVIGILVAYWFTMLPEWTTWAMLVALALYDLAAVLLPVGPLRLLVEMAISRDEEIPALVYEARPVNVETLDPRERGGGGGVPQRRVWRGDRRVAENSNLSSDSNVNLNSALAELAESNANSDGLAGFGSNSNHSTTLDGVCGDTNMAGEDAVLNSNLGSSASHGVYSDRSLVRAEEGRVQDADAEVTAPLIGHGTNVRVRGGEDAGSNENLMLEGIGLGSSGAIKLGLGDFIFYSVLVGRAAMYDYMTVYACYLAIIAGLGITLMLLALYQKALPALPVSIALGILFYFLTRLLLEVFVVQCSLNLLMF